MFIFRLLWHISCKCANNIYLYTVPKNNFMKLDGLPSTVIPPLAVTLTFDLWIPKGNQHISEPIYNCDQNVAKFLSLVLR